MLVKKKENSYLKRARQIELNKNVVKEYYPISLLHYKRDVLPNYILKNEFYFVKVADPVM